MIHFYHTTPRCISPFYSFSWNSILPISQSFVIYPKYLDLWCVVWYVNRTWYSFLSKHYRCAKEAGYGKWGESFQISTFFLTLFCLLTHPTHPWLLFTFYSFEYLLPSHAFFLLVEYLVPTMPSFYSLNIWCWPLRNIRDLTI